MSTLELAVEVAARAHAGQRDKAGMPYILHPIRLMLQCSDPTLRIVAVLHDVVEDTDISIDDLKRMGFSSEVLAAIQCLTKLPNEPYEDFISRILENPLARKVKKLDLLDNMDCTRLNDLSEADCSRLTKYATALRRIRVAEAENIGPTLQSGPCS